MKYYLSDNYINKNTYILIESDRKLKKEYVDELVTPAGVKYEFYGVMGFFKRSPKGKLSVLSVKDSYTVFAVSEGVTMVAKVHSEKRYLADFMRNIRRQIESYKEDSRSFEELWNSVITKCEGSNEK